MDVAQYQFDTPSLKIQLLDCSQVIRDFTPKHTHHWGSPGQPLV